MGNRLIMEALKEGLVHNGGENKLHGRGRVMCSAGLKGFSCYCLLASLTLRLQAVRFLS